MRRRHVLLALLASTVAAAPAARAEVIPGPRPLASGNVALGDNGAGTVAVAYESRRGLVVAVSPRGGAFRRAVRIAKLARGERYDNDLTVTVGIGGDVLVVWDRFDGSVPADDEMRDEGCCTRVHAARLTPGGRRLPTRVLSPRGIAAWHADVALSRNGRAAVTWIQETGALPWRVREAARGGRFGRHRTLHPSLRGEGLAAFTGSVLRALYFRGRSLFERRGRGRPHRIARGIQEHAETLAVRDAAGRLLLARQDHLVAVPARGRARVRLVPRRRQRDVRLASNAWGRTALMYLPGFGHGASRRVDIRLGTVTGELGPPRRVTVGGKVKASWTQSRLAVSPAGEAAVFVLSEWAPRRRRGLYMARIPRFGSGPVPARRVAWTSGIGEFAGAAYGADGRPFAVVRDRGRNRVIRP